MKWAYSIVLVGLGIGCSADIPPTKVNHLPEVAQVDITTDVTPPPIVTPAVQGKRRTDPTLEKAALAGIPVCEKSSMPGFNDGDALNAAINGFNARGEDLDKCNEDIQNWIKKHLGESK